MVLKLSSHRFFFFNPLVFVCDWGRADGHSLGEVAAKTLADNCCQHSRDKY